MSAVYGGASADDSRKVQNPSASGCRCKNHMHTTKQQHVDKDAALVAIIRFHARRARGATFEAYPCPTSTRWHVRTLRKRAQ